MRSSWSQQQLLRVALLGTLCSFRRVRLHLLLLRTARWGLRRTARRRRCMLRHSLTSVPVPVGNPDRIPNPGRESDWRSRELKTLYKYAPSVKLIFSLSVGYVERLTRYCFNLPRHGRGDLMPGVPSLAAPQEEGPVFGRSSRNLQ